MRPSALRSASLPVLALALLVAASACNKSDTKTDKTKLSSEKTEIPSDYALNPMFAGKNDAPVNLEVRGLDGGTLPPGTASAAPATSAGPEGITLVSNGAEPRAARVYAFTGKGDARAVTIRAKMEQEAGGKTQSADAPPMRIVMNVVPKKDPKPADPKAVGFLLTGTITKADLALETGSDPKLAAVGQMLAGASGLQFETLVSPAGEIGQTAVKAEGAKDPRAASQIVQMIPQFFEVLVIPLPKEPIGVGAQWKEVVREAGGRTDKPSTTARTFTLDKVDGDKLTIKVDVVKNTPKQALPDQNAPPGTTVESSGKGSYTFQITLAHLPTKVEGTMNDKLTVSVPDGKGSQSQTTTMNVTLEESK